jgi:hypothetical protein
MSKDKAKSLSELIGAQNSGLGRLAAEARMRTDLSDHVRSRLDEPLASGINHCNLRDDGTLVVIAVNSEWAARLRFESQQLMAVARDFCAKVTACKNRVAG